MATGSDPRQRLGQVGAQVVDRLHPHGQTHQRIADAKLRAGLSPSP